MQMPQIPVGYNTVNPFIITKDALQLIEFIKEVFGAEEDSAAHTMDSDGLLLHSEVQIGNSRIAIADRKPGWPPTLGLMQIYVDNLDDVLVIAERLGAKIITDPTEFFGDQFSRFLDPWDNLWWVYKHNPSLQDADEYQDYATGSDGGDGGDDSSWEPTKEMKYIYRTLLEVMEKLGKKYK